MPVTRAEKEAQFSYVFQSILGLNQDDVLYKVFQSNSFTCIEDVILISDDGFARLQYIDDNGNKIAPLEPLLLRLRIVKAFYFHLRQKHNLSIIDWRDQNIVTFDIFDEFRISGYDPSASTYNGASQQNNPGGDNETIAPKPPKYLASEFRRGVKREKSAYIVLKDERNWNTWKRRTVATLYAHGYQNVVNPKYQAKTLDETLLLREQINFMYDVFAKILQTTMGAHFIAIHEENCDAQAVWKDYTTHMKTSTRADMQIEELMSSLTSLRLSQNYRGTTQTFLIDWLDKMMQYEKMTPLEAHFPPTVKKAMLQNSVQEFEAFKQVKTQEQIEVARGSGPLVFSQYVNLLLNVSSAHDKKFELGHSTVQKRIVSMHEQDQNYTYEFENDHDYE